MSDEAAELMRRELGAARRLARLFCVERSGRLWRLRAEIWQRLAERRAAVLDEIIQLENRRRGLVPEIPEELDRTMCALAIEVRRSEQRCRERLAELGAALRQLNGAGGATGLRDSGGGRLLGRG
jgi:hypothetical protein